MLESLFNKVVTLNFIKRRLQHRCFLLNFLEIIKSIYFVEYQNVLTFGFHFGGFWTFAWINNKLMLHFLHKVRQVDAINLTNLHKVGEVRTCNKSNVLLHNIMFVFCPTCKLRIFQFFDLKYILPKTFFQGISWFFRIYLYIFIRITYLNCLNLVLCLYL